MCIFVHILNFDVTFIRRISTVQNVSILTVQPRSVIPYEKINRKYKIKFLYLRLYSRVYLWKVKKKIDFGDPKKTNTPIKENVVVRVKRMWTLSNNFRLVAG